ncbi:MAG: 3-phosphoshikimate 1-carboxyvinyltransferase [Bacteroidota bacterium]
MIQKIEKIKRVKGSMNLPGDKSISHRAVMFAALAKGKSIVKNYLNSADVNSTINCFRELGCSIEKEGSDLIIEGKGFKGFNKPLKELDAGNSGTTTRLISGILAAQDFESIIIGDDSLSTRPMKRIVDPLTEMGALLETSEQGTLPLKIYPSDKLHSINYDMRIASAQIKSAVLLAGLHLEEESVVIEHSRTRNHTETLLNLRVEEEDDHRKIFVSKKNYPEANEYQVPSDISTASFFIILALLTNHSELHLRNVLLNETRIGILNVLKKMNANFEIENDVEINGEKSGDLLIKSSSLQNIEIEKDIIPNIIDEIPILSVAGIFSEGKFVIRNAKELRVKESDRIKAMCENFKKLGLNCNEFEDGFEVFGGIQNSDVIIESYGDHRIAMAFSVLGVLTDKKISINNFECVAVSNPEFLNQIKTIAQ